MNGPLFTAVAAALIIGVALAARRRHGAVPMRGSLPVLAVTILVILALSAWLAFRPG
jgi:hypothetical protein